MQGIRSAPADGTRAVQGQGAVPGPLNGLRVIELGHYIAGPFATRLLADLGAEVIKIEPPEGDPARGWGNTVEGRSIWWSVHARNKKCVTLNVKAPTGRKILLDLVATADAVVENFRPGQLERWQLGPETLQAVRPDLSLIRISGFGQSGPYREKVAFGVIGEAMGGIRYLTGYPREESDLPPVRVGVSFGDSIAGLYGVIGLLASLFQRSRSDPSRQGACVDVALYEAVFSLMEGALPEYGRLGIIREPAGAAIPTAAPSSIYRCADGQWLCIAANSDRIFERLAHLIGRPTLVGDARFASNAARIAHRQLLDEMIGVWTVALPVADAEARLAEAEIPASRIYTIADCAADPHFRARDMILDTRDDHFGSLLHPGVVPKFSGSAPAGGVGWAGPDLGAHNAEVFGEILGLSGTDRAQLSKEGII